MGRPGETIDTAMLATAIGIDRTVEADIRRVVARDHLARSIERDRCFERWQIFKALPAVVEGHARLGLETAAGVGLRAAPAPAAAFDRDRELGEIRLGGMPFG